MLNKQTEQTRDVKKAWWRFPMMWLIVGGPAVVVVASMLTLALAIHYPEVIIDEHVPATTAASQQDSAAMLPAIKARNHAATSGQ